MSSVACKKSAGQIFGEWCTETTAHGIKDMYIAHEEKHARGLFFWSVIVAAALSIQTWQIYEVVNGFVNGARYGTSVFYTQEATVTLPNVTICNYNRANVSKLAHLGMDLDALAYLYAAIYTSYLIATPRPPPPHFEAAWLKFYKKINGTSLADPNKLLQYLAHDCNETIIRAIYQSEEELDFCAQATQIMNVYGVCFSLPANYTQLLPGPASGLRFILNPHVEAYAPLPVNNYLNEGFVILVNFDPEHPFPTSPQQIAPGTHTLMAISTLTSVFNPPTFTLFPWPCDPAVQLRVLKAQYNPDTCNYDCYVYYAAQVCKCTYISAVIKPGSLNYPTCQPTQTECFNSLWINASTVNESIVNEYSKCINGCSLASCNTRQDVSIISSVSQFPSDVVVRPMKLFLEAQGIGNYSEQDIRHSAVVDIFYSQLGTSVVQTQETQPLFQFISNIGGQIGLWMGASIISVIQMFYYLLMCKSAAFHKIINRPDSSSNLPNSAETPSGFSRSHWDSEVNKISPLTSVSQNLPQFPDQPYGGGQFGPNRPVGSANNNQHLSDYAMQRLLY